MEQPVQRSRMPRGCLLYGLIAGAVILLGIVIIFSVLCFNRDKVVRWSVKKGTIFVKDELAKNPLGLDTARFNLLADQFMARLDTTTLADDQIVQIGPAFQNIMTDGKVDSSEVMALATQMILMFPDLGQYDLVPGEEIPPPTDSVMLAPSDTGLVDDKTVVDTVHVP